MSQALNPLVDPMKQTPSVHFTDEVSETESLRKWSLDSTPGSVIPELVLITFTLSCLLDIWWPLLLLFKY